MTGFPTAIIQNLTGKKYCISVNGERAVKLGYEFTAGKCYRAVMINNRFSGQLEVVIDNEGTYNGRPNKWISISYIPVNMVVQVIAWLEDNGFSHCFATIQEEDEQESDYLPDTKEYTFYIPGHELKDLKRGEYFTLKPIDYPKDSQVWVKDEYDRSSKKFFCTRFSDISSSRLLKGTTPVYTDFTF